MNHWKVYVTDYPPPGDYPPPSGNYPPPPGNYPPPPGNYPPPPPGNYPPPPPPGYSGPGYGYQPPVPTGTNKLAIWSLVSSVIGLLCGIGAIVGIVLGIMALGKIKTTGEDGRGLAIAGIAVGGVCFAINLVFGIYMASS